MTLMDVKQIKKKKIMDEKMRKKFKDMLLEKKDTPAGQAVILSMVAMLDGDPRFETLGELYEGLEEYGNYMTEKEAREVVGGFIAFDGTRGQKWSMDAIADELRKVGGMPEEKHHYNKWMLYTLMNSEYADYGGVLQKLGVSSQDMPKAIYYMALAKISDKDAHESLREYFGLE